MMGFVTSRKISGENFTAGRVVNYILGILETLLAFRLIFKLLGAKPDSGLVAFVYDTSKVLLVPFTAIFRSAATRGIETTAVLEPDTITAMVVYALIAWGIIKLFVVFRGQNVDPI